MISLARLCLDRLAAGLPTDLNVVPPAQWAIYFDELAPRCQSRLPTVPLKQRNALRVELLPDRGDRCSQKSPDGRGLAWLASGGAPLAYGPCALAGCPRIVRSGGCVGLWPSPRS